MPREFWLLGLWAPPFLAAATVGFWAVGWRDSLSWLRASSLLLIQSRDAYGTCLPGTTGALGCIKGKGRVSLSLAELLGTCQGVVLLSSEGGEVIS